MVLNVAEVDTSIPDILSVTALIRVIVAVLALIVLSVVELVTVSVPEIDILLDNTNDDEELAPLNNPEVADTLLENTAEVPEIPAPNTNEFDTQVRF
jgi:hypothetical protein